MNRTPERRPRVFVSSSLGELAAERAAARGAVEALRLTPVTSQERASEAAVEVAEDSDLLVGIYWQSYGPTLDGDSVLEREFRLADGNPRLAYVKEPAPDRDPRLAALIDRIRGSGVPTSVITGAEDLAERLPLDIGQALAGRLGGPVSGLPVGTVTFLFADVEGSTPALERHGDAYAELLARFRRDSESVVTRADGALVQTEGDGIFAVFSKADSALQAAIAAQRTYLSYPPPGPLRARIGLHSGTGVVVDGSYAGVDVHRASRVATAAHGGQIVLSAPARELIGDWHGATVTDLGWFELKGLARPEHLHQVNVPELPQDFPPLRAPSSSRAGLPRPLTTLVGRDADVDNIATLLESGVRLLTLTGPGGIGKTRLALAAAERVEGRYRDGVGFVGLSAVSDPELVADIIASGLGRSVEGTASAEEVVVDELRDRRYLLVLDNFEQVVDRAPLLRGLLERLPELQIVVTSRIALQLSVEREYEVTSLEVPGVDGTPEEIAESSAVRLLLDRARSVRPDLHVTPENAPAVAELVRRLDGIPLAIELAAARLRLLDPADVLQRLRSALELGTGAVDLPPRQRTLRATIDWSFRLLAPAKQTLLGRLGIFVDGWTLDAAETVAGGPDVGDVAVGLDTLAAHSLIRIETIPGVGVRMRLLGPLYDYARAILADSGDLEDAHARHAAYFVRRVEDYPRRTGAGLADWQRKMDLERGNTRQAIDWCVATSQHEQVATFLAALWPLLWLQDRVVEAVGWLEALRPHVDELSAELRAQVVHIDAFFALEVGDFERALNGGLQALEAAAAVGDPELEGRSRLLIAGTLPAVNLDDPRIPGLIAGAIELFRSTGDVINLAYALNFFGSYLAATGNVEGARAAFEEALSLSSRVELLPLAPQSSAALAFVELIGGDLDAAEQRLAAAVKGLDLTPSREVMSYVLDAYGWLALAQGRDIAGLTALGAAEGLRARIGLRVWPLTAAQIDRLARLADTYEDSEAQAARRAGRDLTPEAALAVVTAVP